MNNTVTTPVELIKPQTREEEDILWYETTSLSDMETNLDGTVRVEWDGPYGKHWETFDNHEVLQERINMYTTWANDLIIEHRAKKEKAKLKRLHETKRIQEAKTLGGNFPVLQQLLNDMKN